MSPDESGAPARLRILVVDDHPAVHEGLSLLVSPEGMEICAKARRRADALKHVGSGGPDLAIVDLSLEDEDGLLLVSDLKAHGVPVLVYSMHGDVRHVEGAFAAGALGYVTKLEFHSVLLEAIHAVSAGSRFVSPKAAAALAQRLNEAQADEIVDALSDKERQVFELLGKGEGTYEIAARMNISTHTVASYYSRIQIKLGLEGMYELRRHAIEFFHKRSR